MKREARSVKREARSVPTTPDEMPDEKKEQPYVGYGKGLMDFGLDDDFDYTPYRTPSPDPYNPDWDDDEKK